MAASSYFKNEISDGREKRLGSRADQVNFWATWSACLECIRWGVGLLTMMSDRLDVDLVLNVCFETIIEAGCESTFYAPREPGGRRLLWR